MAVNFNPVAVVFPRYFFAIFFLLFSDFGTSKVFIHTEITDSCKITFQRNLWYNVDRYKTNDSIIFIFSNK